MVASALPSGSFCDPFGGIGVVGRHFKALGYRVTSGDVLLFAHMFQVASINRSGSLPFSNVAAALGFRSGSQIGSFLNDGRARRGWFVEEYALNRKFFTADNARRIQRCWKQITRWHKEGLTNDKEHAVLMASLIDSMDKVANTAGTYYAYLKAFSRKSLKPFIYRLLPPTKGPIGIAIQSDALDLVQRAQYDILYLDPPYNYRDYSAYYHLPETIASGKVVKLTGRSGIPSASRVKSRFTRPGEVQRAIAELLRASRFRLLVFHYSDDGLLSPRDLLGLLSPLGRVQKHNLDALGYRTTPGKRGTGHALYLVSHA
jgi:adenine-specific DNA-methyltransferase